MNYLNIDNCDVANGPGFRVSIWVSGCTLMCPGCHNVAAQNFNAGKLWDEKAKNLLITALSQDFIDGITLTGGHPLEYANLPDVYDIVKFVKDHFPKLTIWLYTGYSLKPSDFDNSVDTCWDNGLLRNYILAMCDVVVDGKYIEEERDVTLKWRGSKNQRLIDVKKTKEKNEIVLWKEE